MFVRILLSSSLLVAPMTAQERADSPVPEKKPDPRIERFLDKRNFFTHKAPATQLRQQEASTKACSVPLTRVIPPALPYMPKLMPRVNTHSKTFQVPAPPCDERRDDSPASRINEPNLKEQAPEARP